MPFKACLLFNKKNGIRSAIYLDKEIVNTAHRKDYIVNDFIPRLKLLKKKLALIYVSGMPYIRTLNAMSIMNEISLFIGVSLLLTSLIFFSFPFLQSYINRYYNCNYR
jgi:hypothetical protein